MADPTAKEMLSGKKISNSDSATNTDEFECSSSARRYTDAKKWMKAKIADTNMDQNMVDTFSPSELKGQKMTLHNIYIGDFECSTLIDGPILAHLPEPYTFRSASSENTYKIAPAGNKGLGMFATSDIPTGGLIAVEHPVIVWPLICCVPGMPLATIYDLMVERLEPPVRRELLSLSNCKSADECGVVEGILRTNNIGIDLPAPETMHKYAANYRGIFLTMSRCNHSCGPNAAWHWDAELTFSLSLVATHPIHTGEEITVSYCDTLESHEKRHAKLRKMYNIDCKCKYCDLPNAEALAESDRRRKEIEEFWSVINPRLMTMSSEDLIKAHFHALVNISKEGLWYYGSSHFEGLAVVYQKLGDQQNLRRWGEKARDAYRAEGRDGDVLRWDLVLQDGPLTGC